MIQTASNNGMQRRPRSEFFMKTCEAARGPADACPLGVPTAKATNACHVLG
jgi:hypothetical protein